jgi:hypothetical protein
MIRLGIYGYGYYIIIPHNTLPDSFAIRAAAALPSLQPHPPAHRYVSAVFSTLIAVVIMVLIMTYVIMPTVTKLLRPWLSKKRLY